MARLGRAFPARARVQQRDAALYVTQGSVVLAASSGIVLSPRGIAYGSLDLSASASLNLVPLSGVMPSISLAGGSGLSMTTQLTALGTLDPAATAGLKMTGQPGWHGTLDMAGTSNLYLGPLPYAYGSLDLDGAASLSLEYQRYKPVLMVSITNTAGVDPLTGASYPAGLGVFNNGLIVGSTVKTESSQGGLFVYAGAAT